MVLATAFIDDTNSPKFATDNNLYKEAAPL